MKRRRLTCSSAFCTMPTKLDIVLSMCFLPPTFALVVVPTVVSLLEFLNDTMA